MTPTELAEEIGCARSTVWRAIHRLGIVPVRRSRGPGPPAAELTARDVRRLRREIRVGRGSAGHWQKGVRRSDAAPRAVRRVMRRAVKIMDRYQSASRRALAAHLGVSDRTVRRWIAGEDLPSAADLARVTAWLDGFEG